MASDLADASLVMLQELRGGGGKTSLPSSALDAAVSRIRVSAARMSSEKPSRPDREAYDELVGPALDYPQNGASFVPLENDALSLPECGAEPKDLAVLLGPTGVGEVESFVSSAILPNEVRQKRLAAEDTPTAFLDPGLRRCRRRYVRLVQRLVQCGVLEYGRTCDCDVGLFAVSKKSGKQRLVVDARRSNLCFIDPPSVSLPTAASFTRIELAGDQQLHAAQFDLSNAFYQMPMREELLFLLSAGREVSGGGGLQCRRNSAPWRR